MELVLRVKELPGPPPGWKPRRHGDRGRDDGGLLDGRGRQDFGGDLPGSEEVRPPGDGGMSFLLDTNILSCTFADPQDWPIGSSSTRDGFTLRASVWASCMSGHREAASTRSERGSVRQRLRETVRKGCALIL